MVSINCHCFCNDNCQSNSTNVEELEQQLEEAEERVKKLKSDLRSREKKKSRSTASTAVISLAGVQEDTSNHEVNEIMDHSAVRDE